MGKNIHVEFGVHEDEVVVWSDFTACVKIWCLKTGRAVEIRDPKFSGKEGKGWGYRPSSDTTERGRGRGGVLALLCRSAGTDVLLLLAANIYSVLSRTELPTTDAAGLRWSRDGRWLAIWDAPSTGYKLCIYTADGHLYRSITREAPSPEDVSEWDVEGLGIKTLEWVPGNERLAVGGWDRRVRILSTRTFAPVVFLDHTEVCVFSLPFSMSKDDKERLLYNPSSLMTP
jgi:WD40 repeat protein